MSEKTQPPTPKKLQEARKKGQIPKSKVLSSALVTLSGLAATLAFSESTKASLVGFARATLSQTLTPKAALFEGVAVLARGVAPSLVGALGGALAGSVLQVGLEFRAEHVKLDLSRLDPIAGLKRLFSVRQLVDLVKGLAIAGVVLFLSWSGSEELLSVGATAVTRDGVSAASALFSPLGATLTRAALVLAVLGVADWALARHRHLKDLMMSPDEVKREHKSSEGDPHHKAKRKSLHKQLATQGSARGVAKATAVVVNPTHIAIALRYVEGESDAPYIVAKGREEAALKIRTEAAALNIPVVRDVPLARSLIHYDVGEEVPEELYQAAAAILMVALEQQQAGASVEEES